MINYKSLHSIQEEINSYPKCQLMIVTKNRPLEDVQKLINLGFFLFGENRVQEAKAKFQEIQNDYKLHLIGPLQSNKVKIALKTFDTIQTLNTKKLINEIEKEFNKNKIQRTKDFYIQVNIGEENQKSGVNETEVEDLFYYAKNKNLNIKGLMCIPPLSGEPSYFFKKMVKIRDQIDGNLNLSMGMSNDYIDAIKCSSNMVRIGSKIFI